MNRTSDSSRRRFLQRSVFATGASVFGFPAVVSSKSPNSKMNIGFIAAGGRGGAHVSEAKKMPELVDVIAMCDVNSKNLEYASAQFPKARTYKDFREMHANMNDIDAVFIATTEHTHAFATLPALRAGKHVYCEKPLTRDVHECRVVMEAAAKANVTTQMGTQMHATPNYRRIVELVQSGAIGPVREAHVWVGRAWGLQSEADAKTNKDRIYVAERPTAKETPPADLDWDL